MMRLLFTLMIIVFSPAHAGEIYKWTDANGKVHFGDRAPGAATTPAQVVDPRVNVVESRMSRGAPPPVDVPAQRPAPRPAPHPAPQESRRDPEPESGSSACQAQWRAYDESRRCYEGCAIRRHDGLGWNTSNCQCVNVAVPNCRR